MLDRRWCASASPAPRPLSRAQAGGMVGRYNTRGESVGFGFTRRVGASGGREAACRSVVNLGTPH